MVKFLKSKSFKFGIIFAIIGMVIAGITNPSCGIANYGCYAILFNLPLYGFIGFIIGFIIGKVK